MSFPRDVPEWLRPAVESAVDCLPGDVIRLLASGLPGGFTKVDIMRMAWKQAMRGFRQMDEFLATQLLEHMGVARLLRALDPAFILGAVPHLRALAGDAQVDVSLWLDSRESVSALAVPHPEMSPPATGDGARQAWLSFVEQLLLKPCGCSFPALHSTPAAESPGSVRELERAQKHLEDAKRRHKEELRELKAAHETEMKATTGRVAAIESERDASRQALGRLQSEFHTTLRREIDQALDARWGPWFARAEGEAGLLADSARSFEDLVRQADHALEIQAGMDRQHGNRVELRHQLNLLRERRQQLETAGTEALNVSPVLARVRERLADAIRVREKQLGDPATHDGAARDLKVAFSEALNRERVEVVGRAMESLASAGIVSAEAVARLRLIAQERIAVLNDEDLRRRIERATAAGPHGLLARDASAVVLVDAYNVIGEAGDLLGLERAPERLPASLREFLPRLRKFAATRPNVQFEVFVDSPNEQSESLGPNVRVTYSGGQGRNRADQVIHGQLIHLASQRESRPLLVISNDGAVRQVARDRGAEVLHPRELARRMAGT